MLDHNKLVPIKVNGQDFLPCHFHSANGIRVTSLKQLAEFAAAVDVKECDVQEDGTCAAAPSLRELHLYAVPAGRVFMHSAHFVGQIIDLPHVEGGDPDKPVYLQVLSISPAVLTFTISLPKRNLRIWSNGL